MIGKEGRQAAGEAFEPHIQNFLDKRVGLQKS